MVNFFVGVAVGVLVGKYWNVVWAKVRGWFKTEA